MFDYDGHMGQFLPCVWYEGDHVHTAFHIFEVLNFDMAEEEETSEAPAKSPSLAPCGECRGT